MTSSRGNKKNIGCCGSCGVVRQMHRDHILPKALGGSDDLSNIQLLCANCHEDKTLAQASEIGRVTQARPGVAERRDAALRLAWNKPEVRARRSAAMREVGQRPEIRAFRSALARGKVKSLEAYREREHNSIAHNSSISLGLKKAYREGRRKRG